MRLRTRLGDLAHGYGAIALLVLAVLAPTTCVLWFMNEAVRSQAAASRREVMDAYRGQMRLLRGKVDQYWQERATRVSAGGATPAEAFRRLVVAGDVDSVILFDANGRVSYPSAGVLRVTPADAELNAARQLESVGREGDALALYSSLVASETNLSRKARAAQGMIRTLVRSGDTAAALAMIARHFAGGAIAGGGDRDGRLIAADVNLLAMQLSAPTDSRHLAARARLVSLLNDYGVVLPSAQRLFLMQEVKQLAPDVEFPTMAAERLAVQVLERSTPRTDASPLMPTAVPGVWQMAGSDRRAVALYTTAHVQSVTQMLLDSGSTDVGFAVIAPGEDTDAEAIAAGAALPGWQIAFASFTFRMNEAAVGPRTIAYLWAGGIAISIMLLAAAGVARAYTRHMHIARLKTDLVAAVSHELRTPLASMRVLVDGLLADDEIDPRKAREYLELIAGENTRLARVVENFLTFSRLERNRHQFTLTMTTAADVVAATLAAARERLHEVDALQVEVDPDLPPLIADADALTTALLNLLDNAWKYTLADKRIAVRVFRDGGDVVFAVEDNGIGIPVREHRRIFQRFYRVDRRLSRDSGGSGLGLSIVAAIARAHGGSVRVESEPERGSTFALRVPARDAGAVA